MTGELCLLGEQVGAMVRQTQRLQTDGPPDQGCAESDLYDGDIPAREPRLPNRQT